MSLLRRRKLTQTGSNHSHRVAVAQERQAARRLGGRVTPRSGAGDEKGDVRLPGVARIECKCTKHASFSVTLDMWDKIEQAALMADELPVMEIRFIGSDGKTRGELAVVPLRLVDLFCKGKIDGGIV